MGDVESPYEKLRLRKLEENKKKIEELNLTHLSHSFRAAAVKPSPSKVKQVKRKLLSQEVDIVLLRRSDRVASRPLPVYTEVKPERLERPKRVYMRYMRRLSDRVYASDEARQYAIEKAEEIQSKLKPEFPSFVKPMTQSHVTGGFWLGLPTSFCTKYLPRKDTQITLIDEDDNESQTLYLANKKGLSAGWRGFSIEHGLVDGDALVYQLVMATKFKVYIIRGSGYSEDDGATHSDGSMKKKA